MRRKFRLLAILCALCMCVTFAFSACDKGDAPQGKPGLEDDWTGNY